MSFDFWQGLPELPVYDFDPPLVYEPVEEEWLKAYARHAQQAADDLVENGEWP